MPRTQELIRTIVPISGPAQAPRVSPSLESQLPLPQPGQSVLAVVVAKLSDNVAILKIAGGLYRADIDLSLRQGDTMQLTYRGSIPRPTFSLEKPLPTDPPAIISKAAAIASESAKSAPANPTPLATRPLQPLLNAPIGNTTALASALKNALANSGIFYESHLAQWFLGERNISELKKEPQCRLTKRDRGEKFPLGKDDITPTNEQFVDVVSERDHEARDKGGLLETILSHRDSEISALVREQIQTATTGIFRWQGEAWPGQEMAWEVEQKEQNSAQTGESPWKTTIQLHTPHLGNIEATIVMSGKNVTCLLRVSESETFKLVRQEQGELENRMVGAGLKLTDMVVRGEQ